MTALVSLDGHIVPPEAAEVSVFDRGFLYGDSVCETWRSYGGVPFALAEHLAALKRSAKLVGIALGDGERLRAEILALVRARGDADAVLQVVVTRGTGATLGLDPALARSPLRVVLATDVTETPAWMYERGVAVVTYATRRSAGGAPAAGSPLGVGLSSVLALREAERSGADDALILNADREVLEGTSSNVFLVTKGALVTPPEEAGIVAGVTRGKVLELAARLDIPTQFRSVRPSELAAADEAFLASELAALVPVTRVDGNVAGGGRPGPVTQRLLAAYRALTQEPR